MHQSNELNIPLLKLRLQLRESAELCRADGGEVGGVAEEDCPFVSDPLVEI